MDYLDFSSATPPPGEPFCTTTPLDFSMYSLEHLEGVHARRSLVARPEKSVLTSVGDMRMEVFGSRVYHALEKVRGLSIISDNIIINFAAQCHSLYQSRGVHVITQGCSIGFMHPEVLCKVYRYQCSP